MTRKPSGTRFWRSCAGFIVGCTSLAVTSEATEIRFTSDSPRQASAASAQVDSLLQDGRLVLQSAAEVDELGHRHERLVQHHRGVPVWGSGLTRQTDARGTVSVFGTLFDGIGPLDDKAAVSANGARVIAGGLVQGEPELYIFPTADGLFSLAWRVRSWIDNDLQALFIDARTGLVLHHYSDLQTLAVSGLGTGVLGDRKKMSVTQAGSLYLAMDQQRPARIMTYDMRGSFPVFINWFSHYSIHPADAPLELLGTDSDNDWTDGPTVDAHTYAGWTYDYYFKRHGRHGLDNKDLTMVCVVNPASYSDIQNGWPIFDNAFWDGSAAIFGIGLPGSAGQPPRVRPLAGALDIVAHELTHGVTQYTSNLIYQDEPGALNEAFSDIMGVSVDFFQNGARASYLQGEDAFPRGARSLQNPFSLGQPDHYSIRYTGPFDNGGVHINSTIVSHAFYLAIEGGTNRVSNIPVTGVGATNREQIEKVYYRAFTLLLPSNARFSDARAATLQAARDLYGTSSAALTAITQSWDAVGVQ